MREFMSDSSVLLLTENKSFFIVDDLTRIDLKEKKKQADKVTEPYNQGTRFFGGKWRDASGKPYQF